jgi:hypothetical protein
MRRLPAWRLVAEVRKVVAVLAVRVWVQVGQVVAAAMGRVAVVVQTAVGGGACRGVRNAGVEGQWELARVERRHVPGRGRNRRRSALQVWPLVI